MGRGEQLLSVKAEKIVYPYPMDAVETVAEAIVCLYRNEQTVRHFHCFTEGGQPRPYICGGYDYLSITDSCYKYDGTIDQWTLSGTMPEGRAYSAYGHSEMWGLVAAGGLSDNANVQSSVITTKNGQVFGALPDLPDETAPSCVVILDEDRIFASGGYDTLIFSKSTDSWSR